MKETGGRTARDQFLERYLRGEHKQVWAELRSHAALTDALRQEALEVSRETMRRVLRNSELLISRLAGRGWLPFAGSFRIPPTETDARAISEVEAGTGAPLPPSLKAFWEVVGGIVLFWDYEQDVPAPDFGLDLPMDELDPLTIDPARHGGWLFAEWKKELATADPEAIAPFRWDLAPDQLHKADFSGDLPYGVELPFLGADPPFVNEEHRLSFVEYLRLAFRFAGFPGLELYVQQADVRQFIDEMTDGFVAF